MPGEALAFIIVVVLRIHLYMIIYLFTVLADPHTDQANPTARRGVLVSLNVDGSRTSGVGFFGLIGVFRAVLCLYRLVSVSMCAPVQRQDFEAGFGFVPFCVSSSLKLLTYTLYLYRARYSYGVVLCHVIEFGKSERLDARLVLALRLQQRVHALAPSRHDVLGVHRPGGSQR